jgi:hypothetical protein
VFHVEQPASTSVEGRLGCHPKARLLSSRSNSSRHPRREGTSGRMLMPMESSTAS